jgi:ppGpp synthetase/RelA/SpoT-type nucleotidyltranferase
MASEISKTQIDKLGDRLKKGEITEADLRLLDDYRRSFSQAYEFVAGAIRKELALEPTGRPAKSTISISDKLIRESIRLTQIQDIAGCRLIVAEIAAQNRVVDSLKRLFENAIIVDRRKHPSHGYRAVHVIVKHRGKLVEVQVRTSLQQVWAELSEKLSDVIDPAIKYGRGDESLVNALLESSATFAQVEATEAKVASLERKVSVALSERGIAQNRKQEVIRLQRELQKSQDSIRQEGVTGLRRIIDMVEKR